VRGSELEAVADKEQGVLTSLRWRGEEMLVQGPQLNVWRATTDNDGIRGWSGRKTSRWGAGWPAGLNELTLSTQSVSAQTNRNGTITLSIHQTWHG
jgi:hypothetical protein